MSENIKDTIAALGLLLFCAAAIVLSNMGVEITMGQMP